MIGIASARLRRAFVALAMTTAAVATVVGVAEPAHAATSCTTQALLDEDGHYANQVVTYGDFIPVHVNVKVTCTDGHTYASTGTITVQRSTDGGATWSTVTPEYTSSAYWSRYTGNWVTRSTAFRAYYSGGTDSLGRVYAASSDTLSLGMIRHTKQASGKSVRGGYKIKFAITPAASIKGLHVTFQVKKSGVWKFYKRLQVTRYGTVTTTFAGSRTGRVYRMLQPSGRGFLASRYGTWKITLY